LLRKLLLAALMVLGLAAVAPQGASAAPVGPSAALVTEATPATVEKAQYYRRGWGPRPYYGRRFYGPRRFYY